MLKRSMEESNGVAGDRERWIFDPRSPNVVSDLKYLQRICNTLRLCRRDSQKMEDLDWFNSATKELSKISGLLRRLSNELWKYIIPLDEDKDRFE